MGEKIPKNPHEFPVPGSINLGVVVTKLFEKAKKVGALTKITRQIGGKSSKKCLKSQPSMASMAIYDY